jgi:hypothetical protein
MVSMALQAVSSVYSPSIRVALSVPQIICQSLDRHYTYLVQGHQWKRLENIMDAKVVQMGFERNEKQAKTADAIRMRCMRGGILIGLGEIQRMAKKPDPVSTFLIRSS